MIILGRYSRTGSTAIKGTRYVSGILTLSNLPPELKNPTVIKWLSRHNQTRMFGKLCPLSFMYQYRLRTEL